MAEAKAKTRRHKKLKYNYGDQGLSPAPTSRNLMFTPETVKMKAGISGTLVFANDQGNVIGSTMHIDRQRGR